MLTRHPLLTGLLVALATLVVVRLVLGLVTDALAPGYVGLIAGLTAGVAGFAVEARLRRAASRTTDT